MSRSGRSVDWGFPRRRGYGGSREAVNVRICDRHGCNEARQLPRAQGAQQPRLVVFLPSSTLGEYNRRWDYFEGLEKEEAEAREGERAARQLARLRESRALRLGEQR